MDERMNKGLRTMISETHGYASWLSNAHRIAQIHFCSDQWIAFVRSLWQVSGV